jgi:hypothetical protein
MLSRRGTTMQKTNPIASLIEYDIRPAGDDDLGYIVDTWARSLWPEYQGTGPISVFSRKHKQYIDYLIKNDAAMLVACDREAREVVYGWIVASGDIIRFVYVRNDCRRAGIARALVEKIAGPVAPVYTSSRMTRDARAIKAVNPNAFTFLPLSEI